MTECSIMWNSGRQKAVLEQKFIALNCLYEKIRKFFYQKFKLNIKKVEKEGRLNIKEAEERK